MLSSSYPVLGSSGFEYCDSLMASIAACEIVTGPGLVIGYATLPLELLLEFEEGVVVIGGIDATGIVAFTIGTEVFDPLEGGVYPGS